MAKEPFLVSTWFSPWSERVRWALDHHGVKVRRVEHAPFLGERRLRRFAGNPPDRVSVPLLVDGDAVIRESWDIARWAEARGSGAPLFPAGREDEVRRLVDLADWTSDAGRGLTLAALAASSGAVDEALPPFVPGFIRPLFRPIGRYGTRWFGHKWAVEGEDEASRLRRVRSGLDQLRAALPDEAGYLLGSFSYADIACATVLQAVSPVDGKYIRLGRATRAAWTRAELAADYPDLLRWRDRLYAQHRARR